MKLNDSCLEELRSLGVGLVYLYGSHAEGYASPQSDFDVGIVFVDKNLPMDMMEIHGKLYDIFTEVFPVSFQNDIDLVYLQQTPISFQYSIIQHSSVIYEISPIFRADYEERLVREYLDFKYIKDIFSQALLERK